MSFPRRILSGFMALSLTALCACSGNPGTNTPTTDPLEDNLLLHLSFDEGSGTTVNDSAGKQQPAEVSYQFTNPAYTVAQEPGWRTNGVAGGSLLFDGCSTSIAYAGKEFAVEGEAFSISVWVAPRAFEWDDPNAQNTGNAQLTAIVSQFNKDKKLGFALGYQRFGKLCFEVGTGDKWVTVWGDTNLSKYEWNYVTAVFDGKGGSVKLYLNGREIGSKSVAEGSTIAPASKEKLLVGKNAHATAIAAGTYCMFSGLMDELKLYDCVYPIEDMKLVEAPEVAYEDIMLENNLTEDIFKTQFHGGPYQHWMNEPHCPIYYNGMYHLFYQQNIVGSYWRNICWGHLVSEDMVSWRPVKEAITPTENTVVPDGVWSGNGTYDKNGVPLLFFTAGNDSFAKERLISNQNIGIAYPADLNDPELIDWVIYDRLAVQQEAGQGRPGEFRDPYLWQQDGKWCMLVCSGSKDNPSGGAALLYTTDRLELLPDGTIDMDWQYKGSIYEMPNQSVVYGTSWELPILIPMTNDKGDTKWFFSISPAPAGTADNKVYYFMGDFDLETATFTPDPAFSEVPALLDYGDNVFTGPSAYVDPQTGEVTLFSIMQDKRLGAEEGAAGWAHCVGLPRTLKLNNAGTDVELSVSRNVAALEQEVLVDAADLSLEDANAQLANVKGDLLHIKAVLENESANEFGLTVKSNDKQNTRYTYSVADQTISGSTTDKGSAAKKGNVSGALALEDNTLEVEVYVDRSLVEGFFNEERAISIRSFSDFDAQGVSLFADGGVKVKELHVATMGSIYK